MLALDQRVRSPSARSIADIERTGVPRPPKLDAYLKSRVDKMYAQLAVSLLHGRLLPPRAICSACHVQQQHHSAKE